MFCVIFRNCTTLRRIAKLFTVPYSNTITNRVSELRRILLSDAIILPGCNRLAAHRVNLCLANDIHFVKSEFTIGVWISFNRKLLTYSIEWILDGIGEVGYPVNVRVSDGLDGSGCHRIYQQATPHPEIITKSFLLFGFNITNLTSTDGETIWKNHAPNSPFSIRPISILPENEDNVKFLMDTMINGETTLIEELGLKLRNGDAKITIVRSMFDTSWAKILRVQAASFALQPSRRYMT